MCGWKKISWEIFLQQWLLQERIFFNNLNWIVGCCWMISAKVNNIYHILYHLWYRGKCVGERMFVGGFPAGASTASARLQRTGFHTGSTRTREQPTTTKCHAPLWSLPMWLMCIFMWVFKPVLHPKSFLQKSLCLVGQFKKVYREQVLTSPAPSSLLTPSATPPGPVPPYF